MVVFRVPFWVPYTFKFSLKTSSEVVDDVSVFVYADDIKLLIYDPTNCIKDCGMLVYKFRIQPTKSEIIIFFRKPAANSMNQYSINEIIIQQTSSVLDLGITLSSDFNWHAYVSKIFAKSVNLVYFIIKTFNSKNQYFLSIFSNFTYVQFLNTTSLHGCYIKLVTSKKLNLFRKYLRD